MALGEEAAGERHGSVACADSGDDGTSDPLLPGSLSPRATLSHQASVCSEVEEEASGDALDCDVVSPSGHAVDCGKSGAGATPRAFFPSDPTVYLGAAATAVGSDWDVAATGAGYGWEGSQAEFGEEEDDDEEGPGSHGYCINCTAPLWSELCPDCGHAMHATPALFDAGPGTDACSGLSLAEAAAARTACPVTAIAPVAVAYDEAMLLHEEPASATGGMHPERPDRIRAAWARLRAAQLTDRCVRLSSRPATDEELMRVHSRALVSGLQDLSSWHAMREGAAVDGEPADALATEPGTQLSSGTTCHVAGTVPCATPSPAPPLLLPSDTYSCAGTAAAARLGAGAAADVAVAVARGDARAGMAIVRPPGHHAESGSAQGFCFFNNAAVAARAAQAAGAGRVLILDWDVHHGNGTQEVFWRDDSVLYVSLHRHEGGAFYPGTGAAGEVGQGPGAGATVNLAWPCGGLTDAEYEAAAMAVVLPIAAEFAPDLVVLSAGFDAAAGDPIGGCHLTPGLYARLTRLMAALAPCVAVLEGGYNLAAVAACTEACVRALLGERVDPKPVPGMGFAAAAVGMEHASVTHPDALCEKLGLPNSHASTQASQGPVPAPTTPGAPASLAWRLPPVSPGPRRAAGGSVRPEIWRAIADTAAAHAPYWACMSGLDAALRRGVAASAPQGAGDRLAWGRRPASCPPSVCCAADSGSVADEFSSESEDDDPGYNAVDWVGRGMPGCHRTPVALGASLHGALTPASDAGIGAATWTDDVDDGQRSPPTKRARGVLTPQPFASEASLSLRF